MNVKPFPKFILYMVFMVFFAGFGTDAKAENDKAHPITLQLKWYHQFQFAGYYAAKEKGFYNEAGLDVKIKEGSPHIKVQDLVVSGEADFGILGSELVALRAEGVKIVSIAPIMQHSIRTIIARQDMGISSPHNLIGKRIMLNKNELPEFHAMFLSEGINIDELIILDKTKTANAQFISGEIEAINGSLANQPFLFKNRGIPYTLIKPLNYGIDFYGDTLFTTEQKARKSPELVTAFMEASFKGWKYAFDHPEELIEIIINKYNARKSKEHLHFEQSQLRDLIHPDLVEIGHNNPERWLHIKNTYEKLGIVPAGFSLDGFFFKDYLQKTSKWINWLALTLGVVCAVSALIMLYNFQLRKEVEHVTSKIQKNNEYLNIILTSIGDGVLSVDLAGNVVTMNPVAEKLTGWSLQEATTLKWDKVFNLVNSKTRTPVDNLVSKVLAKGEVVSLADHTTLISKDGNEFQISESGAPMKDATGNTIGVVLVFRDVTAEYQNMEKIIDLGKFPGENPNPVMRISSEGVLRYYNRGSRNLIEHWGTKIDETVPEKWRKRILDAIQKNVVIQHEETYPGGYLSLAIAPVKDGGYVNIYGMDITEQKEHFERFRTVMDSLDSLVYVSDMETYDILFINKYGIRIWGDITGKVCWQTLQADQTGPCFFCTNDQLLNADSSPAPPVIWEFQNTVTNEWYECRDQAIRWMDGRMVRMEIATNITARKEAEIQRKKYEDELRQAHKLEAIGTIAGGIAHDFNNILGIIMGNIELAYDTIPEDNEARENLKEVITASLRARDVVRQLLNFSRKSEEEKENINAREALMETIQLLRASIPTSIDIITDLSDEAYIINADPTQFHQVLINLCTNAAHSMEEKGGTLSIGLSEKTIGELATVQYQTLEPGHYVQLTIKDTGCGIDPKIKDKIFDPYFTTKDTGKGTGMGLAVVLGIVKTHNGFITVDSEPEKGTVFKVLFPKYDGEIASQEKALEEIQAGTERVLFVDDEQGLTTLGKIMLEKIGYAVETENDPQKALDKVIASPDKFDLIITDMTMPKMTGERLVKKILEINPKIPIILTTGFSNKIDEHSAIKLGVRHYIEKPFNKRQLAQAINAALRKEQSG